MASEPAANLEGLTFSSGADLRTAELARWTSGLLVAVLVSGAAILFWRRLAGALSTPLDPVALLAVAIPVAAIATVSRALGGFRPTARRSVLLSASVLSVGAALSLRETSPLGLTGLWAVLIVSEIWAWRPGSLPRRPDMPRWRWPRFKPVRLDALQSSAPHANLRSDDPPISSAAPPDGTVTQQLTRSQAPDGTEDLAGWLRVPLAPGQRTANVHVAFCPPFAYTPRARVKQTDGPEARVKTVQLLPYGVRFDLKLREPEESEAAVLLRFSAKATPPTPSPSDPAGAEV